MAPISVSGALEQSIDFHHKLGVALGDAGWSLSLADADDALLLARQRVDLDTRGRQLQHK